MPKLPIKPKKLVCCVKCSVEFLTHYRVDRDDYSKYCSQECYHSNVKGVPFVGERLETQRRVIKETLRKRKEDPELNKRWRSNSGNARKGSASYNWIEDRSLVIGKGVRNTTEYRAWRSEVYKRDNWSCRIADNNCAGRIEAHHILAWKNYPELHYKINNGITLCHAHHPRKRSEEKRLESYLMGLVSVSKETICY